MAAHNNILFIVIFLLAMTGCQSVSEKWAPAILVPTSDKQSNHPLTHTVSYMLNGAKITLADNAFYENNEVIIEARLLGRTFEKPNHFRLWLTDESCVLEHVESGRKLPVAGASCSAQ